LELSKPKRRATLFEKELSESKCFVSEANRTVSCLDDTIILFGTELSFFIQLCQFGNTKH
jgi:hypothetical protein